VATGDRLALGDDGAEVVQTSGVVGLGLSGSAWVELDHWRELVSDVRPDLAPMGPFAIRPDLTRIPEAWSALPLLPPTVPVLLLPARLGALATGLVLAVVVGALDSLRRVWRADPASAMS
jgi:hypothetical protein